MQKHMQARPVTKIKDENGVEVDVEYGRPFTAPPDTIAAMQRRDPGSIDVMGMVDVPEKGHDLPVGQRMSRGQLEVEAKLKGLSSSGATKGTATGEKIGVGSKS